MPKLLELMLWGIKEQTSHHAGASGNNIPTSPNQRRGTQVNTRMKDHPSRKNFYPSQAHKRRHRCSKCGDSRHIEDFKCLARKFHCKTCSKYSHFTNLCYKKQSSFKSRNPKAYQLQVRIIHVQEDSICGQSGDLNSSDESFCLQVKIQHTKANTKFPTPHHLITNLVYRLKPHHKRNQYLRARFDTCANVNIMPASVYKLLFQDPDCEKLAPSKLEIGTYTTDKVKLVWPCMFYLGQPDTKCLQEVTFYLASNNGSVLLSCVKTLALGLIQPHTRLDYLPPKASLITSSADHPKRPSSKSVCMFLKSPKSPTAMVWYPSSLQVRNKFLPTVIDSIGCFPGPPFHMQVNPSVTLKQTPCQSISVHIKESFKKEIDKMLQAGVLKPVN